MSEGEVVSEKGQLTKTRLEQALKRLLDGKPERTPNDGRLSLSRVNKEAGLSSGGIYYYGDFVEKVRAIIHDRKIKNSISDSSLGKITADRMRVQRDKERELKERYRSQRDNIKEFCDQVVSKNAQLEFALFEALDKIERLESEALKLKVIDINNGKAK